MKVEFEILIITQCIVRLIHEQFRARFLFFLIFNVSLFLREAETEHEWGKGRERGRHRIQSRLQALSCQPSLGLEPTNRDIMT